MQYHSCCLHIYTCSYRLSFRALIVRNVYVAKLADRKFANNEKQSDATEPVSNKYGVGQHIPVLFAMEDGGTLPCYCVWHF